MEQTFNSHDVATQEDLFFGLDQFRGSEGTQYADLFSKDAFPSLQYETESFGRLSSSPDVSAVLYQSQAPQVEYSQSPEQFQYGNPSFLTQGTHQSFPGGWYDTSRPTTSFPMSWNSNSHEQTSPRQSFSNPVDIPMRNYQTQYGLVSPPLSSPVDIPVRPQQAQYGLLSPTSTAETSFLSNSSWTSSHTAMSRTDSIPGSVASFDTAIEEPMQFPKQDITMSAARPSSLNMIEYRAANGSHRLTPATMPGGKRPRGRRGPLNQAQRMSTAHMRNVKACPSCRSRKAKCDPGIPCKQCINYYKTNLIHQPCRGQRLEDIADKVLNKGQVFPRKRFLGTDFGANFQVTREFNIYLSFAFGEPFQWRAQIVSPFPSEKFPVKLLHEHVVYDWPVNSSRPSKRAVKKEWVFPALLMDTTDLKAAVDQHLTRLIDEKENFARFPLFNSPLAILKDIYLFYRTLDDSTTEKPAKQLLRQALKLMNLIHIGGDIRMSPSPESRKILDMFFSPDIRESDVVPCYIRSQLGEVFSKLASDYMKEVLSKLEIACLTKDCSQFALIVSTFALVCMSIESVQHKTQKQPFHFVQDGAFSPEESANLEDEVDGIVDLLSFYNNCFGGCHRDRLLSVVDMRGGFSSKGAGSSFRAGEQLIAKLREGIQKARPYLVDRSKDALTTSDVTVFFDRLVARLLLLET